MSCVLTGYQNEVSPEFDLCLPFDLVVGCGSLSTYCRRKMWPDRGSNPISTKDICHENHPNGRGDVAAVQQIACAQRSRTIVIEEASYGMSKHCILARRIEVCFLFRCS